MFTGIHVYISELATNYNHYFMLSIMFTGIHVHMLVNCERAIKI